VHPPTVAWAQVIVLRRQGIAASVEASRSSCQNGSAVLRRYGSGRMIGLQRGRGHTDRATRTSSRLGSNRSLLLVGNSSVRRYNISLEQTVIDKVQLSCVGARPAQLGR
jgi:hypothetical protein